MLKISGNVQIENKFLDVIFIPEAVYIPAGNKYPGGLFNTEGNPISQAVTHRGKEIRTSGPVNRKIDFNTLPLVESDTTYFFLGEVHPHFGHFLLEAMARLWPLLYFQHSFTGKYLYCNASTPANLFKKSFIEDIFGGLSLHEKDFANYRKPCRLKNIFVAQPAFEISLHGQPVFRQLMQHIGSKLAGDLSEINNTNPTPLYISKSKLEGGVSCIANEMAIEESLRKKGVDIWHPETLSLSAQFRELSSRQNIMGTVGSAFHALLFCPGNKVISAVAQKGRMQSTYIIIDRLCGNKGMYESGTNLGISIVCPADYGKASFRQTFYASEPDRVAEKLLHNINVKSPLI